MFQKSWYHLRCRGSFRKVDILWDVVLYFDLRPEQKNAIPRWCTGRNWHILMAVMRGNRVGRNWLMKGDELKKIPWYTNRLMHRKRVTCELHDSYFCLMTIKHAISKIEWALNYYITQLSSSSRQLKFQESWRRSYRQDVVGKATSGRRGLEALMSLGPEKMLIRCSKESQHPSEWTPGLLVEQPGRTRKTQRWRP